MTEEQPIRKDELLDRIKRSRETLEETLEGVSEAQMERREEDQWAITDHLAHLAVWERGVAEYLRGRSRVQAMGLRRDAWGMSLEEVNDLIYRQNEALSAAQARQKFEEAHEQMLDALEGMDDEALLKSHAAFLPGGEETPEPERLVLETVIANTYEHYDEHAEYIRSKLQSNQ